MRPRTRLLRLVSQELALELKIVFFFPVAGQHVQYHGCELTGMAQPMSRLTLSSVLKEKTHVFPPARETACDRTVTDPVMPAKMGNISGMPVKVRLSLAEASAIAQFGEHQTEDQKMSLML